MDCPPRCARALGCTIGSFRRVRKLWPLFELNRSRNARNEKHFPAFVDDFSPDGTRRQSMRSSPVPMTPDSHLPHPPEIPGENSASSQQGVRCPSRHPRVRCRRPDVDWRLGFLDLALLHFDHGHDRRLRGSRNLGARPALHHPLDGRWDRHRFVHVRFGRAGPW